MSDIYQIANLGMLDGKQRLEAIATNAASASLPGYRRHVATGRTFDAVLAATDGTAETIASAAQRVDLRRGALISTGRALDLSIDTDDAFFALTDGVQTWLTRAGSFHADASGVLIGEGGLRVIGARGDVQLPSSDVAIAADGSITHEGVAVGALQLFRPNDPASLQSANGALLIAPDGASPIDTDQVRVRSGALEASNTDSAREMLSLMTVSRQFESLSRVLQSYDDLLGRAIQKLGEL